VFVMAEVELGVGEVELAARLGERVGLRARGSGEEQDGDQRPHKSGPLSTKMELAPRAATAASAKPSPSKSPRTTWLPSVSPSWSPLTASAAGWPSPASLRARASRSAGPRTRKAAPAPAIP